jgi:hypothetical protein
MKRKTVVRNARSFGGVLCVLVIGFFFTVVPTTFASSNPDSCTANLENRQMDFWLGDWVVTYPDMAGSANSKVYVDLDKCLIIESWDGGKGHSGKNMFAYSSDDKGWHGMFADNQGRVHVFEGKVAQGSAEFIGSSRGPSGAATLNRIKVVRVTPDKVEQSWEKSTDNGATWKTEFRGDYARKKS